MTHAVSRRLTEKKISTHTPARGVTLQMRRFSQAPRNFNPHSREGSDYFPLAICITPMLISTHTPARGVTYIRLWMQTRNSDFNPHSRKGSDRCGLYGASIQGNFNPHSRKGSDCRVILIRKELNYISTHTPARGVTLSNQLIPQFHLFQPTLPQGE